MSPILSGLLLNLLVEFVISHSCVFPSILTKGGRPINACINSTRLQWWCPIVSDFYRHQRWTTCPQTQFTEGGNDPGRTCVFPFIYESEFHYSCLPHHSNRGRSNTYWCATSPNFDIEQKWTLCRPNSPQLPCYFRRDTVTEQCRKSDKNNWQCATRTGTLRSCPDTDTTFGGNDPGRECHLPFIYRKTRFTRCINNALNRLGGKEKFRWCPTTENYDRDRKWTRCRDGKRIRSLDGLLMVLVVLGSILVGVILIVMAIYYCIGAEDSIIARHKTTRLRRKQRNGNTSSPIRSAGERDTMISFNPEFSPPTSPSPPPPYNEAMRYLCTTDDRIYYT